MEQSCKLSSELTFATVQENYRHLLALLRDAKISGVCLDLGNVVQCDSAGLALLIEAKRLGEQYRKTLEIVGVPQSIYALAEFCGLKEVFAR